MRVPRSIIPITVLACFLIVGCASDSGADPTPTSPIEQNPPSAHSYLDDTSGEEAGVLDAESRQAAVDAAQQAMTAFARPHLDPQAWWTDLAPYLTQRARQDYAYVQPSAITATSVTAAGYIAAEPSPLLVHVGIPTDSGDYMLIVARVDGASPWQIARITPPEGVH